jgi:hypothetical protein
MKAKLGLLVLLLSISGAAAAGNVVFERQTGDGAIELTNVPSAPESEYRPLVTAMPSSAQLVQGNASEPALPRQGETLDARMRALYAGALAAHKEALKTAPQGR